MKNPKHTCISCLTQATLNGFPTTCCGIQESQQRSSTSTITANLREYMILQKQENKSNRLVKQASQRALNKAAAEQLMGTKTVPTLTHEAGQVPAWIQKWHTTHWPHYVGAGMVFCSYCGALSPLGFSSTHFFKPCRRSQGQQIAEGSRGRMSRVQSKRHPMTSETSWPDGKYEA